MLTRDSYIAALEKRAASDEAPKQVDNLEAANRDRKATLTEDRAYLGSMFDEASKVEKHQTNMVRKMFPGSKEKEPGQPLMKTAHYDIFMRTAATQSILKEASPAYLQVAFRGFCNELEKIAAIKPQTMAQLGTRQAVGQRFGAERVWNIGGAAGAAGGEAARSALAPAVKAMRERPWWKKMIGAR